MKTGKTPVLDAKEWRKRDAARFCAPTDHAAGIRLLQPFI